MRDVIGLNFDWLFHKSFKSEFVAVKADTSDFERVDIPHTNLELPYNNFDETASQFVSCYRKVISVSNKPGGKRAFLKFKGVMTIARVYLNGAYVAQHLGGYTPFQFDITDFLSNDHDNVLVVEVDSTENPSTPPFGFVVDFLTYGGIYRDVELEWIPEVAIANTQIMTSHVLEKEKQLLIHLHLQNLAHKIGLISLNFSVKDDLGFCYEWQASCELDGNQQQVIHIQQKLEGVELWDIDSPILYQLRAELNDDGCCDQQSYKFGFREVSFTPAGFFLNGKKVKLVGLNRHQSYPYVGYAMPARVQRRDADILKHELGANCVRTSHYPQSTDFLDRCDELGLLVFNEIPGWQHISDEETWRNTCLQHVEEMITRDWNHPSVFIWGVRINESADCHALYSQSNALARQLDPSRPTGGVRCFAGSELLEDVYTYNDFVHTGKNQALDKVRTIAKANVPYLVTEHNGHIFPTKSFDTQDKLLEHGLRHLRVLDAMYREDGIAGALGWCMFDYNTHEDFGSGDRICYHGVMDMFREPKYAANAYASQQSKKPVMTIASNMRNGDFAEAKIGAVTVFTNCDAIKLYKNNQFIQTFYPDSAEFPHLPHPPIVMDDFIGEQLQQKEGFSPEDSAAMRPLFVKVTRSGVESLSVWQKLKMFWLLRKNNLAVQDAVDLYAKYIGNWGDAAATYRIEGYINGECVLTQTRGKSKVAQLSVFADDDQLIETNTYDATRVVIRCVDEDGMLLSYANDVVNIDVPAPLSLIGPSQVALVAGRIAFWVRSKGETGTALIKINSQRFPEQTVQIAVDTVNK